jgi:hypothetical protein
MFFGDDCSIYILRLNRHLSSQELSGLIIYARGAVGTQYATKMELARIRVGNRADFTTKQFCSRLVAQAFGSVGIKLVPDENFCSPEELKKVLFSSLSNLRLSLLPMKKLCSGIIGLMSCR